MSPRRIFMLVLTSLVFGISGLTIIGYLTGNYHLTKWAEVPMAANTAVCLLFSSVVQFLGILNGDAFPFRKAP